MAHLLSSTPSEFLGDHIYTECCRKCSFKYQFTLEGGGIVTVICGVPTKQEYKAISYLWEKTSDLLLKCRKCSVVTIIPMRDASKIWSLLKLAGGGSTIWLDAMSIDQTDPKDKEAQLFVMGDIYQKAQMVSVLLPNSDEEAFRKLAELGTTADAIVKRAEAFGFPSLNYRDSIAFECKKTLEKLADDYLVQIKDWTENIHEWRYWRRAWTFQEWVMARDVEISCELAKGNEYLWKVKSVVVMASTIIGHWKKTTAIQEETVSVTERLRRRAIFSNEMGRHLNAVRAFFPFEDFLVADESEDSDVLRRKTFMPTMSVATDNGTYVSLESFTDQDLKFRSLLGLALNAMSTSKREATIEADRVACWASMCNIKYKYHIDDSFAVALHKVLSALRLRGVKIYNFLVNTDSSETDLRFLDYAAAHRQSNHANLGYLFGTPAFIGRADTLTHVRHLLSQSGDLVHLGGTSNIALRQVDNVIIKRPISCGDKRGVMSSFRPLISGKADNAGLLDVGDMIEDQIADMPVEKLRRFLFVSLAITVTDVARMWYFNAWTMIPSDTVLAHLFVARESLNGTLVLAVYKGEFSATLPAKEAQIVAYLYMTHQRDGTYLIKADDKGIVDIVFRTADTPEREIYWMPQLSFEDSSIFEDLNDRVLDIQISLGEREFSLFGS